jgi:hypothetical protein
VINASNIVAEIVDLKISFSLGLHLVGAPIGKTFNHLRTGGKAIDGPWVPWVKHWWCSRDVVGEGGSHDNLLTSEPGLEGVTAPLM